MPVDIRQLSYIHGASVSVSLSRNEEGPASTGGGSPDGQRHNRHWGGPFSQGSAEASSDCWRSRMDRTNRCNVQHAGLCPSSGVPKHVRTVGLWHRTCGLRIGRWRDLRLYRRYRRRTLLPSQRWLWKSRRLHNLGRLRSGIQVHPEHMLLDVEVCAALRIRSSENCDGLGRRSDHDLESLTSTTIHRPKGREQWFPPLHC